MSTEYYLPKPPITSIREKQAGSHSQIAIWVNGAYTGALTVRAEEAPELLQALATTSPVVTTFYGGERAGRIVVCTVSTEPEETRTLISESGKLTTLKELKATSRDQSIFGDPS